MRLRDIIRHGLLTLLSLLISLIFVIGCVLLYFVMQLPDVAVLKDMQLQVPLQVYSQDGLLIAEFGHERRDPISLNQVPKLLIDAVLATEDQRYYEHPGIDLYGLLRAGVVLVSTGIKSQGGSTITMQVARNFLLTRNKTYTRKIKEILLALKIDSEFSKEKILELYLNKIYFGNHAYGIAAAAKVYFGKQLNQLTLSEMAMLAGLPKAPSSINPLVNPVAAKERRNHVLARMLEHGYIDKNAYETAVATPLVSSYHGRLADVDAMYVAEMVRDAMLEHFGDNAYENGYKVYTTISSKLQAVANQSLRGTINAYNQRHKPKQSVEGALVALNPKTGAILSLVGGYNYYKSNFNRAIQANRQPGSNFKPFIYAAALDKGFTLASIINDAPIVIGTPGAEEFWRPQNENHKFHGPTRLRVALTKSTNVVSIRLLRSIGLTYAIDYLSKFGFEPSELPKGLSLALGTATLTPLELATGYTVFANGGYKVKPYLIDHITDNQGKVIYQAHPVVVCELCAKVEHPAPQVISSQTAYLITSVLKDVIRQGTGRGALTLKRTDIAGKTGTTNEQRDAWFSGFNSDIVATAWLGFDHFDSLYENGAQAALPMWVDFMRVALADLPERSMPEPSGIVTARIDPATGLLASPGQQNAIFEIFKQADLAKLGSAPATSGSAPSSSPAIGGAPAPSENGESAQLF